MLPAAVLVPLVWLFARFERTGPVSSANQPGGLKAMAESA